MSSITRTITVTRKGMQHQIQIVEGTSLLPISIIVSDYDILSGSAAVAYNRQPNGTLVNQACTISENTISFTPPEGFYLKGYNKTQVRVTNNNRNLFSFVIDVWCDENITDDADVEEINSQPTLVTQLLSQIGVLTARMDAFTALPEGSTTSDAALNDIRIGYDGTEYPTPGDAVRGQAGSLSAELIDIRVGADGETYENAGTAVREQFDDADKGFQYVNNLSEKTAKEIFDEKWEELTPDNTYTASLSGVEPVEERYTKCIIDTGSARSNDKLHVYKIKGGITYKIKAQTFKDLYVGLGMAFLNIAESPKPNTRYDMLDGYDYWMGNNETAWKKMEITIKSPENSRYLFVHGSSEYQPMVLINNPNTLNVVKEAEFQKLEAEFQKSEAEFQKLEADIYNQSEIYTEVNENDGLITIENVRINLNGKTEFNTEAVSGTSIFGIPVKEGEKLDLQASTFGGLYIGAGYVWATTTDVPPEGGNAQLNFPCLSSDDYDYYMGNDTNAWGIKHTNLVVPQGAVMIWVNNREGRGILKKARTVDTLKFDEKSLKRELIFPVPEQPTVTEGTISSQKKFSRLNRSSWLWEFNTVGKLTIQNMNLYANNTDKAGIWIYMNEEMLAYGANTDGVFSIYVDGVKSGDDHLVAYRYIAGWNYIPIDIKDSTKHTIEFSFTLVRGNYQFAIDTFEVNYIPHVKPQILLSFDMAAHSSGNVCTDNRYNLVHSHGFVATFCNPDTIGITQDDLNKVFAEGWDWAIYNKADSSDLPRPDYDTGSLDDWKTYIKTHIDSCASIGLFNPFTYFSPENRGSVVLEKALKELGFTMARIAGSDSTLNWFDDYNGLYMSTVGIGGKTTASEILQDVDEAIESNSSIIIFTHNVEDSLTNDMNTTVEVFSTILDGISERVNKGLCEVSTFADFYQKWCPNGYANAMRIRQEKEKQYILSKIAAE